MNRQILLSCFQWLILLKGGAGLDSSSVGLEIDVSGYSEGLVNEINIYDDDVNARIISVKAKDIQRCSLRFKTHLGGEGGSSPIVDL